MTTSQGHRAYLNKMQLTLEQGWAVSNPYTREFLPKVGAWGFPKHPDRTVILPPTSDLVVSLATFVTANSLFFGDDLWLGTWIYPRTGEVYLAITTSCLQFLTPSLSKRQIISVYNSQLDETVYL